ncbi:MAG: hypothetical protein JXQ23_11190 [Clostridia bacterium]|nr:hypothetical protein [Clostridia bacterium]
MEMPQSSPADPIQNITTEPTPTATAFPPSTPSPTPVTTKPTAGYAFITSPLEENRLNIFNNESITYSGNIVLTVYLTGPFTEQIKNYIYINSTLVNPDNVSIGLASLTINLDETLPENYSLTIRETDPGDENGLSEEFNINFIHHAALAYEISIHDPLIQSLNEPPIYLSAPSQSFKFLFNKPVNEESLQFLDFMKDFDIETNWLSDTEMIMRVHDLPLFSHNIGIGYISGSSPEYGNIIRNSGRYTDPTYTDLQPYHFMVSKRQNLYVISPENNEMEILDDFDYGMIFEDTSNNLEYLSLGIITNEMEGWHYSKAIYNVNSGELTPLDTFISESITQALDAEITTYATTLYNPMVENEFWDNENNYHYFFGNSIFNIDPSDFSAEIYFSDYETSTPPYPVFHLENGGIAAIRQSAGGQIDEMWVIDDANSLAEIYQLPFTMKTGEGWIHYIAHVADAGDSKLLVSGYEFVQGEENFISSYLLDLDDGELTLITKGDSLIDYFKEPGYLLCSNYNQETMNQEIDFVSLDGTLLYTLPLEEGVHLLDFVYNAAENTFYIKKYSESSGTYSIMIMDAENFGTIESNVTFQNDIWLIGVNHAGRLLVMDKP